jgi:hypothetical protein
VEGFFRKAGLPVQSIDGSICDSDKDVFLNGFIDFLTKLSNTNDVLDDVLPSWLADLVGDFPLVDRVENIASLALYGVELGRKNFDKAFASLLQGVPGIPNGEEVQKITRYLTDGIDMEGSFTLDDSLSDTLKEKVLDNVWVGYAALNTAFPPTVPITGILGALHLFGRKMWDEAIESLLTLGVGKLVSKILKFFTDWLKLFFSTVKGVLQV